jgi:undecaprenyl-diphosphatase
MELFNAIILGIIQGLTEFLPVSSSGHLELAKVILGDKSVGEESMLMTVTLHAATALSTMIVFRKEIIEIFQGLFQFKNNEAFQFSLKIVISMIPAACVGLLFEEEIETLFNRQIIFVGAMLLLTGVLLYFADKAKNTGKTVSNRDALIIGIAQAIAILPGISRSGATISTSVLLGIDRERAARFSFLMVVPLIIGKMSKDIIDGDLAGEAVNLMALSAGFIAAFLTGLFACVWMIKLVKNSKLTYFSIYCVIIGTLAILYGLFWI